MSLASYALAALLTLAPAARRSAPPGWVETEDAYRVRVASIAESIAAAATEACGDKGAACRRWSAAILIGIGTHETRWAPDADAGACYRGPGWERRCDGGRAKTVWQMLGSEEEGRAWAADRKTAAREALRQALRSWNACRKAEPALRWASYARGRCGDPDGQRLSRELDAPIQAALRVAVASD